MLKRLVVVGALAFAGCAPPTVCAVVPAVVLDRSHVAGSMSTGFTSSGKVAMVSNPEQWTVVVQAGDEIVAFDHLAPSEWARFPPGQRCAVVYYKEWWAGRDLVR